jgi:hypothetical protein
MSRSCPGYEHNNSLTPQFVITLAPGFSIKRATMRGRFWCGLHTTTLALLPLVLGGHARAAENEPKVITMFCDGMLTPT